MYNYDNNTKRACGCGNNSMMSNYTMNDSSFQEPMTASTKDFSTTMEMAASNPNCVMSGVGCCCNENKMNSIPTYSYEFTSIKNNCNNEQEMTAEEMLQKIRCLDFACTELAQYLDTHVDDSRAICLHKEYATKLNDLREKYQKVYGPLTIYFPCNKWRWLEEPWPWERGNR